MSRELSPLEVGTVRVTEQLNEAFFVSIVLESGGTLNFPVGSLLASAVQSLASNLLFEELVVEEIERLIGRPVKRDTETLTELVCRKAMPETVIPFPGTRSIPGESPVRFEEIAKSSLSGPLVV